MKPTAHLVNTARGPSSTRSALHEALVTGRIAGAGLDVFGRSRSTTPPSASTTWFCAPHVAGIDETSEVAMANRAIDAILAMWRGEAPPKECVVDPRGG